MSGGRKSGIWKFNFVKKKAEVNADCIACITTRSATPGLCGDCTTDVHRAACALGFYFSRRRDHAGRIDGRVRTQKDGSHGAAGSRWRVWIGAVSPGCAKDWNASAHRRRSYLTGRMEISVIG